MHRYWNSVYVAGFVDHNIILDAARARKNLKTPKIHSSTRPTTTLKALLGNSKAPGNVAVRVTVDHIIVDGYTGSLVSGKAPSDVVEHVLVDVSDVSGKAVIRAYNPEAATFRTMQPHCSYQLWGLQTIKTFRGYLELRPQKTAGFAAIDIAQPFGLKPRDWLINEEVDMIAYVASVQNGLAKLATTFADYSANIVSVFKLEVGRIYRFRQARVLLASHFFVLLEASNEHVLQVDSSYSEVRAFKAMIQQHMSQVKSLSGRPTELPSGAAGAAKDARKSLPQQPKNTPKAKNMSAAQANEEEEEDPWETCLEKAKRRSSQVKRPNQVATSSSTSSTSTSATSETSARSAGSSTKRKQPTSETTSRTTTESPGSSVSAKKTSLHSSFYNSGSSDSSNTKPLHSSF